MSAYSLSIYDGRRLLGRIIERGPRDFEAFDFEGRSFGRFRTRQAASAAIPTADDIEKRLASEPAPPRDVESRLAVLARKSAERTFLAGPGTDADASAREHAEAVAAAVNECGGGVEMYDRLVGLVQREFGRRLFDLVDLSGEGGSA